MALTPTLSVASAAAVINEPFKFLVVISGSGGPFNVVSIQPLVRASGAKGYEAATSVAVSPVVVGLPYATSSIDTNTGSFPFNVVCFAPLSGSPGSAGVSGSLVYDVVCLVYETTTPSVTTTNLISITASSLAL